MRAAVLAVLVATGCREPGSATLERPASAPRGPARHYELFAPPGETRGMPLVIALHGNGGTGRQMQRMSGFDAIAAREHFVVAYPDAIDHHWNDGRPELANGVDDVAFIASLIDELATTRGIDRTRVYVTGMSNGAMMTYRLGCDLADRIAAIAPVTGNVPAAIRCEPAAPIALLAINGTADRLVPYDGGEVARGRGTVLSAAMSTSLFARRAGCGAADPPIEEPDHAPDDGSRTRRTRYACPPPVAVELLSLEGAGHTWPGGKRFPLGGATSRDFTAAARIWEFFAQHRR